MAYHGCCSLGTLDAVTHCNENIWGLVQGRWPVSLQFGIWGWSSLLCLGLVQSYCLNLYSAWWYDQDWSHLQLSVIFCSGLEIAVLIYESSYLIWDGGSMFPHPAFLWSCSMVRDFSKVVMFSRSCLAVVSLLHFQRVRETRFVNSCPHSPGSMVRSFHLVM